MNPGTVLLIIFAAILAFWAGSRWRHNARTWQDHKGAKAGAKSLRALRWVTLRAAVAATLVVLAYLMATGAAGFAGRDEKAKPAGVHVNPTLHTTRAKANPHPRRS